MRRTLDNWKDGDVRVLKDEVEIDTYSYPQMGGYCAKSTMSKKLDEPTAYDMGIAVPTAQVSANAVTVCWGDVMVCLKEAIAASPEMRADLKAMLEEQALVGASKEEK